MSILKKEFGSKLREKVADFMENNVLNMELIVNTYSAYVSTIIKNSISNNEDIEELVSDVFVVLWNNQRKLDSMMNVKPYLIGITKNLIKKKYRELNSDVTLCDIDDYSEKIDSLFDVTKIVENHEREKIILNIIESLKFEEKDIFILFYYKSKKVKEIAKELKISTSKVKVTLHRLRKIIKNELKKRGYSYE